MTEKAGIREGILQTLLEQQRQIQQGQGSSSSNQTTTLEMQLLKEQAVAYLREEAQRQLHLFQEEGSRQLSRRGRSEVQLTAEITSVNNKVSGIEQKLASMQSKSGKQLEQQNVFMVEAASRIQILETRLAESLQRQVLLEQYIQQKALEEQGRGSPQVAPRPPKHERHSSSSYGFVTPELQQPFPSTQTPLDARVSSAASMRPSSPARLEPKKERQPATQRSSRRSPQPPPLGFSFDEKPRGGPLRPNSAPSGQPQNKGTPTTPTGDGAGGGFSRK